MNNCITNKNSFISFSAATLIFTFLHLISFSQKQATNIFKDNRQFAGIQSNPYFTMHKSNCQILTLRYGIEIHKNIFSGPEISGFLYKDKEGNTGREINTGLFMRFVFFDSKTIKVLIEPGISYKYGKYQIYHLQNPNFSKHKLDWYGSAGISINLYREKVSLDLMVKYAPDYLFLRSRTFVPSYKLNYHF